MLAMFIFVERNGWEKREMGGEHYSQDAALPLSSHGLVVCDCG